MKEIISSFSSLFVGLLIVDIILSLYRIVRGNLYLQDIERRLEDIQAYVESMDDDLGRVIDMFEGDSNE